MIKAKSLSISFGNKQILNDLTFEVKQNEIFGFLEPSGVGKITTIKILTNQLNIKFSNGSSCFNGNYNR